MELNKTRINLPDIVTHLVVCFSTFDQQPYLVGGAVRDHLLNKETKDLDLFIPYKDKADFAEIKMAARRFGYTCETMGEGASGEAGKQGIVVVVQLKREGYKNVECILTEWSLQEYIDSFPIGLSKVVYSVLSGGFAITKEFEHAVQHKQLYYSNIYHKDYVERIGDKYPNYTIKYVPEKF